MNSKKMPFGRHKGKTWGELPTWGEQLRRAGLGYDLMERDAALYSLADRGPGEDSDSDSEAKGPAPLARVDAR